MRVARTWVFPIIRILIFAAIAAALVKIAFFAQPEVEEGPEFPSAEIVEPQVAVSTGTILNEVLVAGTVSADAARPVKATLAGEVVEMHIKQGEKVKKDQKILTIREEIPGEFKPDGSVGKTTYKYAVVKAGVAGTLSNLGVIKGQLVAVGDPVGQIAPPTFNVSGTIAPDQLYRLLNEPTEATVTVIGGPAPFACTKLTISIALAGEVPDEEGGGGEGGTSVRCAVPKEVRVFNGLQAEMSIPGGVAENVLVVPATAVEGAAGSGNVYVMLEDGTSEIRPVALGLSDGMNVQITDGLVEGDMILEFVPGAPEMPPMGENCYDIGDGTIVCDEPVR